LSQIENKAAGQAIRITSEVEDEHELEADANT